MPTAINPEHIWIETADGDPVGRAMFGRHYTYRHSRDQMSIFWQRNRNYSLFVGPGEKMVLLTPDQKALFVWRKFKSMDSQRGVNNAVFRNEGTSFGKASALIKAADALAWRRWPGERLYTYVHPRMVRPKATPGHCFVMAGYRPCGFTNKGLLIFEHLPTA